MWAQRVASGHAVGLNALRMVLAEFDDVTPANLAAVADSAIKDFIASIVPVLAFGMRQAR
jgi:hypothetical protein